MIPKCAEYNAALTSEVFSTVLLRHFLLDFSSESSKVHIGSQIPRRAIMILTPCVAAFFPGALFMISKWFVHVDCSVLVLSPLIRPRT
jgi:hypothetical protein